MNVCVPICVCCVELRYFKPKWFKNCLSEFFCAGLYLVNGFLETTSKQFEPEPE